MQAPAHANAAFLRREGAVLRGVGGELVEDQAEGERFGRRERHRRSPDGVAVRAVRAQLQHDDVVQIRAAPDRLGQQIVGRRQGQQPRFEGRLEGFRIRAGAQGLGGDRLHRGQGVLHPVIQFVQQELLLLLGPDSIGDVAAFDEDAPRRAAGVEDRLEDEVDEAFLGCGVRRTLQHDAGRGADIGLSRPHHLGEDVGEGLSLEFGHGLHQRPADQGAVADQLLVGVVHQPEGVVRSQQDGHEARRLHEEVAELVGLLDQDEVGLLQFLGALEELGGALHRRLGRRFAAGAVGHVLQALDVGHVDRVLQEEGDLARLVEEGRVDGRPVAHLEPAAERTGQGDGVGNEGQGVRLAGGEHPLEGFAKLAAAGAFVGKQLEHAAAEQFLAAALRHRLIGQIGFHEAEFPVQHHVRTGQILEKGAEIDLRQSLPPVA